MMITVIENTYSKQFNTSWWVLSRDVLKATDQWFYGGTVPAVMGRVLPVVRLLSTEPRRFTMMVAAHAVCPLHCMDCMPFRL